MDSTQKEFPDHYAPHWLKRVSTRFKNIKEVLLSWQLLDRHMYQFVFVLCFKVSKWDKSIYNYICISSCCHLKCIHLWFWIVLHQAISPRSLSCILHKFFLKVQKLVSRDTIPSQNKLNESKEYTSDIFITISTSIK